MSTISVYPHKILEYVSAQPRGAACWTETSTHKTIFHALQPIPKLMHKESNYQERRRNSRQTSVGNRAPSAEYTTWFYSHIIIYICIYLMQSVAYESLSFQLCISFFRLRCCLLCWTHEYDTYIHTYMHACEWKDIYHIFDVNIYAC